MGNALQFFDKILVACANIVQRACTVQYGLAVQYELKYMIEPVGSFFKL